MTLVDCMKRVEIIKVGSVEEPILGFSMDENS